MKKYIFTVIVLLIFCNFIYAQRKNPARQDQLKAQKIAFFTDKLQLTPSEAEKFWPVYNDYELRKNKISRERRITTDYYIKNAASLSDKEIGEILDKYISYQVKETELLKEVNEKLKKILPESKVIKVYITEIQYRKFLLDWLRENR